MIQISLDALVQLNSITFDIYAFKIQFKMYSYFFVISSFKYGCCLIIKYLAVFQTLFSHCFPAQFHYTIGHTLHTVNWFRFVKFILWLRIWLILVHIPCALEEKHIFCCCRLACSKNVNQIQLVDSVQYFSILTDFLFTCCIN